MKSYANLGMSGFMLLTQQRRKILETSLHVESFRPDKPDCRQAGLPTGQAGGNDIECGLIYEFLSALVHKFGDVF